jgi:hypothetical protein
MEKADETTGATGHVNKVRYDRINEEITIIDQEKDLFEMNDATSMEGGSVIIGEHNIVQDGSTDFINHEYQALNHEEGEWEDYSSEHRFAFSDSSVKQSAKHIHGKSKKKFTIPFDEDSENRSECYESGNSCFSQTSLRETAIDQPSKKKKMKKTKRNDLNIGKDMLMMVFNPCTMVFSPLVDVIMLLLTILNRRP